jgi:holo-[acyl-carrier protein] synthase
MIIGTGQDITDIRRIEKTLNRFANRFIIRCFAPVEIQKAERRRAAGTHIATYAKRFAAKEACAKALGTGFSHGVFMRDIVVQNDDMGKPVIVLTGGALNRLQSISNGRKTSVHLSLTDDYPYAMASVIIECL